MADAAPPGRQREEEQQREEQEEQVGERQQERQQQQPRLEAPGEDGGRDEDDHDDDDGDASASAGAGARIGLAASEEAIAKEGPRGQDVERAAEVEVEEGRVGSAEEKDRDGIDKVAKTPQHAKPEESEKPKPQEEDDRARSEKEGASGKGEEKRELEPRVVEHEELAVNKVETEPALRTEEEDPGVNAQKKEEAPRPCLTLEVKSCKAEGWSEEEYAKHVRHHCAPWGVMAGGDVEIGEDHAIILARFRGVAEVLRVAQGLRLPEGISSSGNAKPPTLSISWDEAKSGNSGDQFTVTDAHRGLRIDFEWTDEEEQESDATSDLLEAAAFARFASFGSFQVTSCTADQKLLRLNISFPSSAQAAAAFDDWNVYGMPCDVFGDRVVVRDVCLTVEEAREAESNSGAATVKSSATALNKRTRPTSPRPAVEGEQGDASSTGVQISEAQHKRSKALRSTDSTPGASASGPRPTVAPPAPAAVAKEAEVPLSLVVEHENTVSADELLAVVMELPGFRDLDVRERKGEDAKVVAVVSFHDSESLALGFDRLDELEFPKGSGKLLQVVKRTTATGKSGSAPPPSSGGETRKRRTDLHGDEGRTVTRTRTRSRSEEDEDSLRGASFRGSAASSSSLSPKKKRPSSRRSDESVGGENQERENRPGPLSSSAKAIIDAQKRAQLELELELEIARRRQDNGEEPTDRLADNFRSAVGLSIEGGRPSSHAKGGQLVAVDPPSAAAVGSSTMMPIETEMYVPPSPGASHGSVADGEEQYYGVSHLGVGSHPPPQPPQHLSYHRSAMPPPPPGPLLHQAAPGFFPGHAPGMFPSMHPMHSWAGYPQSHIYGATPPVAPHPGSLPHQQPPPQMQMHYTGNSSSPGSALARSPESPRRAQQEYGRRGTDSRQQLGSLKGTSAPVETSRLHVGFAKPLPEEVLKERFVDAAPGLEYVSRHKDKCFAFVKYSSEAAAKLAMLRLNGKLVLGQTLKVSIAQPPKDPGSSRKRQRTYTDGPR